LTPTERAVFVLREAFGMGYDEIAAAVGKTPAAVHQLAHRARRHVEARRPRRSVTAREAEAAAAAFRRALETRDLRGLLDVLAPDVVAISDGGGIKQATPRPVIGAGKVARFIVGGLTRNDVALTVEATTVNGSPALALYMDGELDGVIAMRVEDTRIAGLYYVRNPQKLTRVDSEMPLTLR
jgi:RNA polymerase sigma-70 factor (ECF subfamily)